MTAQFAKMFLHSALSFGRRYSTYLWIAILSLCAGAFFLQGRGDFARALETLANASPAWITLLITAQIVGLALGAATYQLLLRPTGNSVSLRRLTELHLERKVVGTLMPAGGPASVYVFVRGIGRHGVAGEDALLTIGLKSLVGYASFVSLLVPALLLARPGGIFLAGALVLLASFLLFVCGAVLLLRPQHAQGRLDRRAPQRAAAMLARVRGHRIQASDLSKPYLLALLGQFANVVTLAAALYALGYSPSLIAVLAGYTVGNAVVSMTPVFQGIGLVEVSMAVTLEQFGVPPEAAIGATLLYRGATVWLPLLLGGLLHAGRRLPAPSIPAWSQARPSGLLSTGLLCTAVAVPALVLALMVTQPWSNSSPERDPSGGRPYQENRIGLTVR